MLIAAIIKSVAFVGAIAIITIKNYFLLNQLP